MFTDDEHGSCSNLFFCIDLTFNGLGLYRKKDLEKPALFYQRYYLQLFIYNSMRRPCTIFCSLIGLCILLQCLAGQAQTQQALGKSAEESLKTQLSKSKADTNRVNLLLQLGNPVMDGVGKAISNLNTAYYYSTQAELLSKTLHFSKGQIKANYQLAYYYLQKKAYNKSRKAAKKGIRLANENAFTNLEAEGWHYLGDTYADDLHRLGDTYKSSNEETVKEKVRCFKKAVNLYEKAGNKEMEAEMRMYIVYIYFGQGKNPLIIEQSQKVIDILPKSNFVMLHYACDMISMAQHKSGNYTEALQYGLAGLNYAISAKDSSWLPVHYFNLASIYLDLKQPAEAHKYFEKGLFEAQHRKFNSYTFYTLTNINRLLLRLGRVKEALVLIEKKYGTIPEERYRTKMMYLMALTDCYLALKRYSKAEEGIIKLLRYNETRPNEDIYKMAVYDRAGILYLNTKLYKKARNYIEAAMSLNLEHKSLNAAMHHQLLLFRIDSAQGNLKLALNHYQHYKILSDSIYSDKNGQQIAILQIQYETREKEQNIALLIKQNEVQRANLGKRALYQQMFAAGALMLLLLLAITYNRYRLKRRSTQLLEERQQEINRKNQSLHVVLQEKDALLKDKENLILHKDCLLEEKEWLLKEIHHRVKNNLQIVMSLLNSQAAYLQDSKSLSAIQESQQRVHSISLIHQKLYQSEKVALLQMSSYIREVTEYLSDSFDANGRINFELDIIPLELDVGIAVPLGLLINEAVTNCLKYAFPGNRLGTVVISISPLDSLTFLLKIADDGIGLKPDFDPETHRSLGMSLIRGLSKQLGGDLNIESRNGVTISVCFVNSLQPKTYAFQT